MSKKASSTSYETKDASETKNMEETAETTEAVSSENSATEMEPSALTSEDDTTKANDAESSAELAEKETEQKTEKERCYGFERFLQINPVSSYEKALLRTECAMEVMTISEWLAKLQEILNRKVQQ